MYFLVVACAYSVELVGSWVDAHSFVAGDFLLADGSLLVDDSLHPAVDDS